MSDYLFPLGVFAAVAIGAAIGAVRDKKSRDTGKVMPTASSADGLASLPTFPVTVQRQESGVWKLLLLIPILMFLIFLLIRTSGSLIAALLSIPVGLMGVRFSRIGIELDEDGVSVRNFFTTRFVPWSQIEVFLPAPYPKGGIVRLREGGEIRSSGLSKRNPISGEDHEIESNIAFLNGTLELIRRGS